MNGDRYDFTKDSTEDSVFHITINGDKSSVYESITGVYPEMKYTALSSNTMVGEYQSGGGITVETWSITTEKKSSLLQSNEYPGHAATYINQILCW
ncbi:MULTISPECIES: hypothetical protein [Enterobacteriaceae]|uniref:hypothetical protein n=1 Tax=Enterobacteriaceae TaxID=543 RepID=UPI00201699C5|nr:MULTISPECIES: hypothetical protein [Enterobacteriaceae]